MKDFLLTLLNGFVFIIIVVGIIFIGLSFILLVGTFIPKPIITIGVSIFVLWFVGAVIKGK